MEQRKIRIGCGAGFSGDRLEPALVLAESGALDYLVLECLAERTIALAQKRKLQDAHKGYDPLLEKRITQLLPILVKNNIRLLTNMGAANPIAAAEKIKEIALQMKLPVKIAAVTGDDVKDELLKQPGQYTILENEEKLSDYEMVSANAYMGIDAILPALHSGAQIIITGRVADPSLFLAPMVYHFGWKTNDCNLLGRGTIIGHLLECAGHITGGYFADPVKKPVPDLANLGHPFADVFEDGSAIISKCDGTGGMVTAATVKEQLLYEVLDPAAYYTPDTIANFCTVRIKDLGNNRVSVTGGSGKPAPATLKVSVGYKAFYLGEGEISYAGQHAFERAKLAAGILTERLKRFSGNLQVDYIGLQSVHHSAFNNNTTPYEIRLRVAAKAKNAEDAALVGEETEALYTNGPAAGGGVRKYVTEIIGIVSVLLERSAIHPGLKIVES